MGRWQPLRSDLPAEAVRLVRELRQYVDRCELNAATLAARTGYSRSSWLRYLNGRRLPPWQAVAGLGRLAQADAEHLRVLWESAAHAWTKQGPPANTGPQSGPSRPSGPPDTSGLPNASGHPDTSSPPYASASSRATGPAAATGSTGTGTGTSPATARSRTRRTPGGTGALTAAGAACALLAAVLLAQPWDSGPAAGRPPDGAPSGAPVWPWPLHDAQDRAAAACRAGGCRGLDPYREKCDRDSVAAHRLRAYGHVLTLLYSPSCHASWAEVDTPAATSGLRIATVGGDEQPAAAGGAYTTMVGSGPDAARATLVVQGHQLGVALYDSWVDDMTGGS
ncbi:helix-turn-helix domain-containing protein [Streptomyces sp. NPDC020917]|uniref:helix-turn-helix domain-containing protein n=1 Tax=Streptomyces sp. NPDC020917 TaxID=3365102 RepID=UPI0037AD1DB7